MSHESRLQRLEETLYRLLNYLRDQEQSTAGANWRRVQDMIDQLHHHEGERAMAERLGDAPIEEEYRHLMNTMMKALDEAFNPGLRGKDRKVGIIMLMFPFNSHEGRCNYISNGADRKDVVAMLKEQIKRFEGQPDMEGSA
jgi:hypothetical protein